MLRWLPRLALSALIPVAACGGGTLVLSFDSGVVVASPVCQTGGGRFDLRDGGGLVVLVVLTQSTTVVFASGGTGSCQDLFPGAPVDVQGRQSDGQIVATQVTIR